MLNPLPQIQFTDIYRFLATLGFWIGLFSFILYLYSFDMSRDIDRSISAQQTLNYFNDAIEKIDVRLDVIKNNECDKNETIVLNHIASCDAEEQKALLKIKNNIVEDRNSTKKDLETRGDIYDKMYKLSHFKPHIFVFFGSISSIIFIILGLVGWWFKVQKPTEKVMENDLEIQILTIKKTKSDLKLQNLNIKKLKEEIAEQKRKERENEKVVMNSE